MANLQDIIFIYYFLFYYIYKFKYKIYKNILNI